MPEKEPHWLRKAFRFRLSKQEKSERKDDGNRQNSPAREATSTQKETAITTLPEQLWEQAYDDLKHDEPKLFELYETILSRDLEGVKGNVIEQNRTKRRSQMDRLLNTGLDKTARLVHVETNIGAVINITLSVKEAVDSALQAVPIAAVAWTGVCVALQASSPPHSTSSSEHVRSF
jgi:N-terminal domain of NWD NACHT-NTPase